MGATVRLWRDILLTLLVAIALVTQARNEQRITALTDGLRSQMDRTEHSMESLDVNLAQFLSGWEQYRPLVDVSDAKLELQLQSGALPPFSCEVVFVRQYVVDKG